MNIFSGEILENVSKAPMVEKVATANGYVIYMGWPKGGDVTKCQIRRMTYEQNGDTETWTTEFPDGRMQFEYDWADRATLSYSLYK